MSSWLCRNAFVATEELDLDKTMSLRRVLQERALVGDVDFGYSAVELGEISRLTGADPSKIIQDQGLHEDWGLQDNLARISFCPACAREAVKNFCFPIWRKRWSYCWVAACERHRQALVTLRGQYRPINLLNRASCTFRFLVDGGGAAHISTKAKPSVQLGFIDAQVCLALKAQEHIEDLYFSSADPSNHMRLLAIRDFCDLLLRPFRKGRDEPTFIYEMARHTFGKIPGDWANHRGWDDFPGIELASQLTCAHTRLSAMAVAAYIFRLNGALDKWQELSGLGRELGVLIPTNRAWLYAAASGEPNSPPREWHVRRVRSYSVDIGRELIEMINEASALGYASGIVAAGKTMFLPSGGRKGR